MMMKMKARIHWIHDRIVYVLSVSVGWFYVWFGVCPACVGKEPERSRCPVCKGVVVDDPSPMLKERWFIEFKRILARYYLW